jgi:hypothetical protein
VNHIVRFFDAPTLRTVALLNHFWNESANRYLWQRVVIDVSRAGCPADADPPKIRDKLWSMCEAITRYNRAASIRCIELGMRQWLIGQGDSEDHALDDLFKLICSTLAACPRLRMLQIKARHHRRELAERLSTRALQDPFSFQLVELDSSLTIDDGLGPFLLQQASIEKWSIYWLRQCPTVTPQLASPLPGDALPDVQTLWSSASQANLVLRTRTIRRLELTDTDFPAFNTLTNGPFNTVEHLAFKAMADKDDLDTSLANAAQNFARTFPNVRYLRICTHRNYWPSPDVLSALGQFQRLEHISWMGNVLFPKKYTPPQRPDDIPNELPEDCEWSLQFLTMASVEAPTVKVAEFYRDGSTQTIWRWGYERVKEEVPEPSGLIDHGPQVTRRTQWLWTCGVLTVITEEIVHADGRRTLDARITDEYEDIGDDDFSEEDSMEE